MKNLLTPIKTTVASIKEETHDTKTYVLSADSGEFSGFAPGQFNMVGLPGAGEAPISLSSLSEDGSVHHTVRAVGRLTTYMERLGPGDAVFIRGPYGRGWPVDEARGRDLIIVGGGLGLAPLRPVVQSVMKERGSFGRVALAYGARDPQELIYRDELDGWQGSIKVLLTVDNVPKGEKWPHATGLVTELIEQAEFDPAGAVAFVCGPEIMMRFVARRLLSAGLEPDSIYVSLERRMKCGVGQCGHCQHGSAFVCKDGPVFRYPDVSPFPDGLL
jgi:NAD(P)H-flavin reductase